VNKTRIWVIDSGATKHMCNEGKAFTILDKDKQSTVYTVAEYFVKSISSDEVVVNVRLNKNEKNPVKLKDTLYTCRIYGITSCPYRKSQIMDCHNKYRAMVNRPDGSIALTATK